MLTALIVFFSTREMFGRGADFIALTLLALDPNLLLALSEIILYRFGINRALKMLGSLAVITLIGWAVLWSFYKFRYDARPPGLQLNPPLAEYVKDWNLTMRSATLRAYRRCCLKLGLDRVRQLECRFVNRACLLRHIPGIQDRLQSVASAER